MNPLFTTDIVFSHSAGGNLSQWIFCSWPKFCPLSFSRSAFKSLTLLLMITIHFLSYSAIQFLWIFCSWQKFSPFLYKMSTFKPLTRLVMTEILSFLVDWVSVQVMTMSVHDQNSALPYTAGQTLVSVSFVHKHSSLLSYSAGENVSQWIFCSWQGFSLLLMCNVSGDCLVLVMRFCHFSFIGPVFESVNPLLMTMILFFSHFAGQNLTQWQRKKKFCSWPRFSPLSFRMSGFKSLTRLVMTVILSFVI